MNLDFGFKLYSHVHQGDLSSARIKKEWEKMTESEKQEFSKTAARAEIAAFWTTARKRRLSGWHMYMTMKSKELEGTPFAQRTTMIANSWNALSDEEKSKINREAKVLNEELGMAPRPPPKVKKSKSKEEEEEDEEDEEDEDEDEGMKQTTKKVGNKKQGEKKAGNKKEGEKKTQKKTEKKEGEKATNGKRKESENGESSTKKKPTPKKKKVSDDHNDDDDNDHEHDK